MRLLRNKEIYKWGKNLQKLISDINKGYCYRYERSRHCRDFLESFSNVIISQREKEILEELEVVFLGSRIQSFEALRQILKKVVLKTKN